MDYRPWTKRITFALMNAATYIFWIIFVIPLIVFLAWLMKQDRRKGKIGFIVLAVLIIGVIAYMYWKKMFDQYVPQYD